MNLSDPLEGSFRLTPTHVHALKKLGLATVGDLLYHFPVRYGDVASIKTVAEASRGDSIALVGQISHLQSKKAFRKKIPMAEGRLLDETGSIQIVWFHQPYLAKMIPDSSYVRVEGKVQERKGKLYLSNPKIERLSSLPAAASPLFGGNIGAGTLYPIYPETRGVTSNWFYHAVGKIFKSGLLETLDDPIPPAILEKYHLPSLATALIWIHSPKKETDARAARKRFAFEEVFFIQLEKQRARREWQNHSSFVVDPSLENVLQFATRFPFPLTRAQRRAVENIFLDFKKGRPMSRLLEGDVGSGKTAVAAMAAHAIITTHPEGKDFGNLQVAYMAPTEILAQQHFESFIDFFAESDIQIGLITGSGCKKFPSKVNPKGATSISRVQFLKWVANGEIPILIGTHALIQKSVKFKHLGFVIIDEQHRFGTAQRQKFREKEGRIPHLLSMTATPIPRTLALTIYGDLDLTLLDELPPGRKVPITKIVLPQERVMTYEKIRAELHLGRQVYIICPRIDEPDPAKELALQAKSVKEEAKRLREGIFPEFEVGVLHSKVRPAEKESVMNNFKDGKTKILVSTSVVEVGVNVPNATMIIIEGAERFGLAQLHQLRGRVMRSTHQPYCFIFSESRSGKSLDRLKALKQAKNGFELAEFDLAQRGAGELYGRKQWGLSDLGMEAIRNIKMVEAARHEAAALIAKDPDLKEYPLLSKRVEYSRQKIHFE
ncbi:ATP-dependent DNA helicase RecG [Patescibacteria group bacterium]|nr:MAG: ATP-dependent DNA helicase RecG [Patescibacteria group bacterium]